MPGLLALDFTVLPSRLDVICMTHHTGFQTGPSFSKSHVRSISISKLTRTPAIISLGGAIFALASLMFATTAAYFPEPEPSGRVLIGLGVLLPLLVIMRELMNGNVFSVLMWYSVIYFVEFYGCILLVNIDSQRLAMNSHQEVLRGLLVYFSSYLLFLLGYYIFTMVVRRQVSRIQPPGTDDAGKELHRSQFQLGISASVSGGALVHRSNVEGRPEEKIIGRRRAVIASTSDYLCISITSLALLFFSLVQWYYKILAAGGLNAYLENAYRYRFGTFAEDEQSNAIVVLASNISSAAFPMLGAGLMMSWKYGAQPRINRVFRVLSLAVIVLSVLSGSRTVFIFTLIAFTALSHAAGRLSTVSMMRCAVGTGFLFIAYQFAHIYMYVLTAGWNPQDYTETLAGLLAPQGHVTTLAKILPAYDTRVPLRGAGLLESVFFFVPRFIWQDKLPSYGTMPIQAWAGLPTHYQLAPTISGEFVAHWGLPSLVFIPLIGALHGGFENTRIRGGVFLQAAVYCIVLPRLVVHSGMGIGAISITLFQLWIVWLFSQFSRLRHVSIHP